MRSCVSGCTTNRFRYTVHTGRSHRTAGRLIHGSHPPMKDTVLYRLCIPVGRHLSKYQVSAGLPKKASSKDKARLMRACFCSNGLNEPTREHKRMPAILSQRRRD